MLKWLPLQLMNSISVVSGCGLAEELKGHRELMKSFLVHPQNGMRWLESAYPDRARAWVGFNEAVSHRITAAADILLMPSRFEPCGLNQLYAMRCGVPG